MSDSQCHSYPTGKYSKCFILFYCHILLKILSSVLQIKHRCQMTPVFSKDLNLSINHLKLSVFTSVGHLHTQVFLGMVFKWDKRDQKELCTYCFESILPSLNDYFILLMRAGWAALESSLHSLLCNPLANTDSNSNGILTQGLWQNTPPSQPSK